MLDNLNEAAFLPYSRPYFAGLFICKRSRRAEIITLIILGTVTSSWLLKSLNIREQKGIFLAKNITIKVWRTLNVICFNAAGEFTIACEIIELWLQIFGANGLFYLYLSNSENVNPPNTTPLMWLTCKNRLISSIKLPTISKSDSQHQSIPQNQALSYTATHLCYRTSFLLPPPFRWYPTVAVSSSTQILANLGSIPNMLHPNVQIFLAKSHCLENISQKCAGIM